MIIDIIGEPALLEQTAEEAIEFGHACQKLARKLRGENPTLSASMNAGGMSSVNGQTWTYV